MDKVYVPLGKKKKNGCVKYYCACACNANFSLMLNFEWVLILSILLLTLGCIFRVHITSTALKSKCRLTSSKPLPLDDILK